MGSAWDHRSPTQFGWIWVVFCTSLHGSWCTPREAQLITGATGAQLRRWVQRGLISTTRLPPSHHRYFVPELEAIARLTQHTPSPTTRMLVKALDRHTK